MWSMLARCRLDEEMRKEGVCVCVCVCVRIGYLFKLEHCDTISNWIEGAQIPMYFKRRKPAMLEQSRLIFS